MRRCNSTTCMALGIVGIAIASGCGSEPTVPPPAISVTVSPPVVSLVAGGSQTFSATVTNDPNVKGVTWAITGCNGGVGACGGLSNVTDTGVTYTAPATVPPGGLGVTATSITDNTKRFTATVAVTALSKGGPIAFARYISAPGGPCAGIYTMDADGSNVAELYHDCTTRRLAFPAWSPDGSKIAFQRLSGTNTWSIVAVNADGSPGQLVAQGWTPAWSPDGTKIAAGGNYYICNRDCVPADQIHLMNANGSDGGVLWRCGQRAYCGQPTWSPDGQRIAFTVGRGISVMNADGTDQKILTDSGGSQPAWSPDGRRIAFASYRNNAADLYLMNADGTGVTRLTDDSVAEARPAWSPDGLKIAFARSDGIYVMNADGSGVTRLTNDGWEPAWRP